MMNNIITIAVVESLQAEVADWKRELQSSLLTQIDLEKQVAALKAELAALQNQKPVAIRLYDSVSGASIFHLKLPKCVDPAWEQIPLYAAAGAKEKTECL